MNGGKSALAWNDLMYWKHGMMARAPGGPPHDAASPYKRARPPSPPQTSMLQRQSAAYYQDPRYGMTVAAVAGGFSNIYRDPFQP
ncbi:hypothetical protein MAR_009387, partial [Mya arenaria]